jgi:hypothetical protein
MANNFEINLPVTGWILPASNYPARGVVQGRPYLAYDDTTVETARSICFQLPAAYTGSGTLKADIDYIAASATSGKFDFEVSVEAVTAADAVDLDAGESFDTANAGNGTVPGTAGYLGRITVTLTNKDSCAAGDYIRLKLERDADDGTDDTAAGDARVLNVTVREEA